MPRPCLVPVTLTLLASCATPPRAPAPTDATCIPQLGATDFPAAEKIVDGFVELGTDRDIKVGDRLLFGLRLQEGDRTTDLLMSLIGTRGVAHDDRDLSIDGAGGDRDRKIRLTFNHNDGTTEVFGSREGVAGLDILNDQGEEQASSLVTLPADFLLRGFERAAEVGEALQPMAPGSTREEYYDLIPAADRKEVVRSFLTLMSVLRIVQEDEILSGLLQRLISTRDKIAYVLGGSVLSIDAQWDEVVRVSAPAPVEGRPVWCVPITISAGSRPAIHAHALVTAPLSPLGMTGGLLGLHATHATDSQYKLSLVLLGSSRLPELEGR